MARTLHDHIGVRVYPRFNTSGVQEFPSILKNRERVTCRVLDLVSFRRKSEIVVEKSGRFGTNKRYDIGFPMC